MRESLLTELLSRPTAPYRERKVIEFIRQTLRDGAVPHFQDPVGNIIVGASSKAEYLKLIAKRDPEPLRIFVAHMDHPGFHGTRWNSPVDLEVKWHGGAPTHFLEGCKVWLSDGDSWSGFARIVGATLNASATSIDTAQLRLDDDPARSSTRPPARSSTRPPARSSTRPLDAAKLYGGFAFRSPIWRDGELIYTRGADDLVGCFAILSTALDLWNQAPSVKKTSKKISKKAAPPFLAVLTRAEEVGFIGAIGHLELGWLRKAKRKLLIVSLETSRTLPGAEIGKGPVVRTGDRFTVFNAGALRVFTELAEKVLPGKHQRKLMDGGTCEASAFTVYGHEAVGISIPLGNYHNQGFQGGPDAASPASETPGPAPEFVHAGDVEGMVTLCHALLEPKLPWTDPWKSKLGAFRKNVRAARALLRSGP